MQRSGILASRVESRRFEDETPDRANDQRGRDDARVIAAHVDMAAFLAAARDVGRPWDVRV